jgi:hypothetical protein
MVKFEAAPGANPKNLDGKKITKCKDCKYWFYKYADDPKFAGEPHCKLSDRYIIGVYQNEIIPWCKLADYEENSTE